jgi:hypothetical protein
VPDDTPDTREEAMPGIGDMVSGYSFGGRLVTGTVIETDDDGVVVTGIDVSTTQRVRSSVKWKDIITSVPRPRAAG